MNSYVIKMFKSEGLKDIKLKEFKDKLLLYPYHTNPEFLLLIGGNLIETLKRGLIEDKLVYAVFLS